MNKLKTFIFSAVAAIVAFSPALQASAATLTLADCYKSQGKILGSVASRVSLATQLGILNYKGTAAQNTAFAASLCGGSTITKKIAGVSIGAAVPSNADLPGIYNATTTDLVLMDGYGSALAVDRNGRLITSPSSTSAVGGVYSSSPSTLSNGQFSQFQLDSLGNMQVNQYTRGAGEDLTNDVMKVEQQFSGYTTTTNGTALAVKSGTGYIDTIRFNRGTNGTELKVYDALTVTGTPVEDILLDATSTPFTQHVHRILTTGMTLVVSGNQAPYITLSYR